jgi:hypothetical protein
MAGRPREMSMEFFDSVDEKDVVIDQKPGKECLDKALPKHDHFEDFILV